MADNIATLGLSIDSTQAVAATKALQNLQAAAAPAAAAVASLTSATAPAAAASAALASATAPAAAATVALAAATGPAAASTAALTNNVHAAAAAHGGLSTQAMAAFHSIRSMAEGIASGMPATTVLTQQLNHLSYAASGPGGITGAFGEIAAIAGKFISPLALVVGALGALGVAAVVAMTKWSDSQNQVQIGLMGIGAASGQTLASINSIAAATSSLNGISTSQARTVATTLASTGKIGGDAIALLTGNVKNLSIALGTDVTKATDVMAKAFSDPAKGASELADRLGGVDAATLRTIQNLQAQGDRQGAINTLTAAVLPNIQHATDYTSAWARAWNAVSNAASNAFDTVGKTLSGTNLSAMGEPALQARRKQLEDQISSSQSIAAGPLRNLGSSKTQLTQLTGQLLAVNEALMKVGDNAKHAADEAEKLQSLQLRGTFDQFLPEVNARQNLANSSAAVNSAQGNASLIAKMGLTPDEAARAKSIIDDIQQHYQTAFQQMQASSNIAFQAVTAFSPTARATIAQLQTLEQLNSRTDLSPGEKQKSAQDAYNLSLKQTTTNLSEVSREQLLSQTLATSSAAVQLQTIGATVGETYRLTAIEQARAQLVQESARNRTAFDTAQFNALSKQISLTAQLKQTEAERNLQNNTEFNRSQLGRNDIDSQVASQLKAVYGDQYKSQMDSAIADQIRFNAVLSDTKSTAQSALSGFFNDLVQGKSAADALRGSLQTIEKKLIDMATNALISNLFKSLISAGIGGGGSIGGANDLLAGIHHSGGIAGSPTVMRSVSPLLFAGAQRYHSGGLVQDEIPIIARKGERVLTPEQWNAFRGGAQGGNGGGNNVVVNVHNNAPNTTTETRKTSQGGVDVHEITIRAVETAMSSGRFDAPMRARYNNQVVPRSR